MKPRLPVEALTPEDQAIWRAICCFSFHRQRLSVCAEHQAQEQDRRDADLMLQAQEVAQFGPSAAIELYGIACRGWNVCAYWIERDDEEGEGTWHRL
jgi:hypothetical protein